MLSRTQVPSSPQRALKDLRSTRSFPSLDDDVFYTGPVTGPSSSDESQDYRGGYVVDHLVSWVVEPNEDIRVAPERALKRLHGLERQPRGELSALRCSLIIGSQTIDILDNQTGEVCEKFALELVDTPFSSTCDPSEHIYNNVLMFYLLQQRYGEMVPSELHVFQVLGCPARDIAMAIDQRKQRRRAALSTRSDNADPKHKTQYPGDDVVRTSSGAAQKAAIKRNQDNMRQVTSLPNLARQHQHQGPTDNWPSQAQQPLRQRLSPMQLNEPNVHPQARVNGSPGSQAEHYVVLLNRAFDDIEQFVWTLKQENQRASAYNGRKKDASAPRMLTPSPERYVDILQKVKFSLNLLALVKPDLHSPNASELVHFLFGPLSVIVSTAPGREEFASRVVIPLLFPETVKFLRNCLSSRETNLWISLGPAWNLTSEDWDEPSPLPTYVPRFYDGWEPPVAWLHAIDAVLSSDSWPGNFKAENSNEYLRTASSFPFHETSRKEQQNPLTRPGQLTEKNGGYGILNGFSGRNVNADQIHAQHLRTVVDSQVPRTTPPFERQEMVTSSPKLIRVGVGANGGDAGGYWQEPDDQAALPIVQQRRPTSLGVGFYGFQQSQQQPSQRRQQPDPSSIERTSARATSGLSDWAGGGVSPPTQSLADGGLRPAAWFRQQPDRDVDRPEFDRNLAARNSPPQLHQRQQHQSQQQQQQQPQLQGGYSHSEDAYDMLASPAGEIRNDVTSPLLKQRENTTNQQQPQQQHIQQSGSSSQLARQRFASNLLAIGAKVCEVIIDLRASNRKELSARRGDVVEILDDARKWWLCRNMAGEEGYVPFTALQKYEPPSPEDESEAGDTPPFNLVNRRATQPVFIPPPPPPGPPPPPQQSLLAAKSGLKPAAAKPAPNKVISPEERARLNFDSELKTQLAEFRKGNWGMSERALRASLSAITISSSEKDVAKWLDVKGFSEQTKYELKSLSGQKLFAMSDAELVQKLGTEDGSRLASLLGPMRSTIMYNPASSPSSITASQDQAVNRTNGLPVDY